MSDFLSTFSKIWQGGYYEGNPLDPLAPSTYRLYGYNSTINVIYKLLISPYVNTETTILEIGPGRGAWTRCFLSTGFKKIYAVDAAPAEHTKFWEYVGHNDDISYIVADDCSLRAVPDRSIDFFFSFGVFCHLPPKLCAQYIESLGRKMRAGSTGVLMVADFDKFKNLADHQDEYSVSRAFVGKRFFLVHLALAITRVFYGKNIRITAPDITQRINNTPDRNGFGSWFHLGGDNACELLERAGFKILQRDVGIVHRDPLILFRKP